MAWRNKGTGQVSNSSANPGIIYGSGQYTTGTYNNGMDANVWEHVPTPASIAPGLTQTPSTGYTPSSAPTGSGRPLTKGEKRVRLVFLLAIAISGLLFANGNIAWQDKGGFGVNLLPAQNGPNGTLTYSANAVSLLSQFRLSPINLTRNAIIKGNLWHAKVFCLACSITVNGDASYSKIAAPNGSLLVKGSSKHSMLGAMNLTTDGGVSDTWERAGRIVNHGKLLGSNDIAVDPESLAALRRAEHPNRSH